MGKSISSKRNFWFYFRRFAIVLGVALTATLLILNWQKIFGNKDSNKGGISVGDSSSIKAETKGDNSPAVVSGGNTDIKYGDTTKKPDSTK